MNRHLLLYIAAFFLLVSCFNTLRHYLCTWIAHLRTKPSLAKRKRKDKNLPHLFPTKRPECPLCQTEENLPSKAIPPEPPPLIPHKRGRRRSVYTDMRFCPNNDCEYYSWLARGNICSNGHQQWASQFRRVEAAEMHCVWDILHGNTRHYILLQQGIARYYHHGSEDHVRGCGYSFHCPYP